MHTCFFIISRYPSFKSQRLMHPGLYDARNDAEPVFTGSVDEMAEYINEMSDDYHTFDDEIRWIVPR